MRNAIRVAAFAITLCVAMTVNAQSFDEAVAAYKRSDYRTAFPVLRTLAAEGNVQSQFLVGIMYEYGLSVPIDTYQAAYWYRRAATKGNRDAQWALDRLAQASSNEPTPPNQPVKTPLPAPTGEAERLQAEREKSDACLVQLKNDPNLRSLYAKLPFDLTKAQPIEVLASNSKPNAKEKSALAAYSAEKERCLDIGNNWRKQTFPPEVQALANTYRAESISVLADLYAGKLSFGDAAKLRAKQAASFSQDLDILARNYQEQSQAKEQQRIANEVAAKANSEAAEQLQRQNQQKLDQQAEQLRLAREQAQRQKQQDLNRAIDRFIETTRPRQPQGITCTTDPWGRGTLTTCN